MGSLQEGDKQEKHTKAHNDTTDPQQDRKSGSAGMPRPISYAVFCLKKKNRARRCRPARLGVSPFFLTGAPAAETYTLSLHDALPILISRRNIRRRITIPLTLSNLKLLRRITRTENILHRNFTRRQVAIQNRVASNIGISQSTFSVKVLNLFSRSRRKTNKRKSKHSAMLRNKETRHRMFIGLLNTSRTLA